MSRRTSAVLLLVIAGAAGVLAWSGALDPRPRFEVSLPGGENNSAIQVILRDGTGLVTTLQAADARPAEVDVGGAIEIPAGEPTTLAVSWLGGACDDRVDLAFDRVGDDFVLSMHTDTGFDSGCIALGVARSVAIELSPGVEAVDVKLVWR